MRAVVRRHLVHLCANTPMGPVPFYTGLFEWVVTEDGRIWHPFIPPWPLWPSAN